jgi:Tol biopolymer transport system component
MFQGISDWSPDGDTVLFWRGNSAKILEMDLKSLKKTTFLDEPGYNVWQGHFSPDGRKDPASLPDAVGRHQSDCYGALSRRGVRAARVSNRGPSSAWTKAG